MEAVKSAKHKERINELRLKYLRGWKGEAWNMTRYIWENRRTLRTPTGNNLKRKYKRGGRVRNRWASMWKGPQCLGKGASFYRAQGNNVAKPEFLPNSAWLGKITWTIQ